MIRHLWPVPGKAGRQQPDSNRGPRQGRIQFTAACGLRHFDHVTEFAGRSDFHVIQFAFT